MMTILWGTLNPTKTRKQQQQQQTKSFGGTGTISPLRCLRPLKETSTDIRVVDLIKDSVSPGSYLETTYNLLEFIEPQIPTSVFCFSFFVLLLTLKSLSYLFSNLSTMNSI